MLHSKSNQRNHRENGSATITALIVVGVAAVVISGLVWRQQLQIRNIENIRDRTQAHWLQHGMIDFARLVLTQDMRTSQSDHLGEAWALPLNDSKVADFLKNADIPDEIKSVSVNGAITDAQSLFNLNNVSTTNGVLIFSRLLTTIGLNPNLAQQTAQALQERQIVFSDVYDLIGIPGYNESMVEVLRPFVIALPTTSTINFNTAPAEVLMAVFPTLTRSTANNLAQQRTNTPAKDLNEISTILARSGAGINVIVDTSLINVSSQFWLTNSEVKIGNGVFMNTSLIQRSLTPLTSGSYTQVIWNKTNRMLSE
ncbi:type II secretion system minor pseudopilin GspK [Polynucleobacter paneuropaeus]|nr:type II secretion system minor pseudopilin GspK [Polynucleobacter paneuropaeus]